MESYFGEIFRIHNSFILIIHCKRKFCAKVKKSICKKFGRIKK